MSRLIYITGMRPANGDYVLFIDSSNITMVKEMKEKPITPSKPAELEYAYVQTSPCLS